MLKVATLFLIVLVVSCSPKENPYGSIERLDPALDQILSADASIEIIVDSLDWSEGPLWLPDQQKLIFSDVPRNTVYEWTEGGGQRVFLSPSGYTTNIPRVGEPGSNGLALDVDGSLLLCQHGDRRVAKMESSLREPKPSYLTVADTFTNKKFNSPNDLCVHSSGALFFTDPTYGLSKPEDQELPMSGVYVHQMGSTRLLIDSLSFPNGVALSPDEKKLYVAVSDPAKAKWYEYQLSDSLTVVSGRVFHDATAHVGTSKGLPDGLKIDRQGNIFATGPGGVWIFDAAGKLLGKISVPEATSNCALSDDEKILFVTNDMYLLRIKLRK